MSSHTSRPAPQRTSQRPRLHSAAPFSGALHALSQRPQCSGLVLVSTQLPAHSLKPSSQLMAHVSPTHVAEPRGGARQGTVHAVDPSVAVSPAWAPPPPEPSLELPPPVPSLDEVALAPGAPPELVAPLPLELSEPFDVFEAFPAPPVLDPPAEVVTAATVSSLPVLAIAEAPPFSDPPLARPAVVELPPEPPPVSPGAPPSPSSEGGTHTSSTG